MQKLIPSLVELNLLFCDIRERNVAISVVKVLTKRGGRWVLYIAEDRNVSLNHTYDIKIFF